MAHQSRLENTTEHNDSGVVTRRYAPRPRRAYRQRGVPLNQLPNLHLFAMPQSVRNVRSQQDFPTARQVAAAHRRNGAAWAAAGAAGIAAITTGAAIFVLHPADNGATPAAINVASISTHLPTPSKTSDSTPQRASGMSASPAINQPKRLFPSADGASIPHLELSTPRVRISMGTPRELEQPSRQMTSADLPSAANAVRTMARPQLVTAEPATETFDCRTCQSTLPELQQVAVAVFAAPEMRGPTTRLLRDLGAADVIANAAPIGVRNNQVRFYHTPDAGAAAALARRYGAALVDLTWYSPAPPAAQIDLWLADPA